MGGMGRIFYGSYAEYALLPVSHVFPVESDLSWEEMAAIPETYFTAQFVILRISVRPVQHLMKEQSTERLSSEFKAVLQ